MSVTRSERSLGASQSKCLRVRSRMSPVLVVPAVRPRAGGPARRWGTLPVPQESPYVPCTARLSRQCCPSCVSEADGPCWATPYPPPRHWSPHFSSAETARLRSGRSLPCLRPPARGSHLSHQGIRGCCGPLLTFPAPGTGQGRGGIVAEGGRAGRQSCPRACCLPHLPRAPG